MILLVECVVILLCMYSTFGKNFGPGQFGFGKIGHSDKNFILRPCSDHELDTLTRLGPSCSNVRIYDVIFGHFGLNFI